MIQDFLIVHKKILPDYYIKVIEARTLLETSQCKSISQAVKRVGISRSTYYKYKDYVFMPSEEMGRKFTISMILKHNTGILSEVLGVLKNHKTSILTIHQDIPINDAAVVNVSLDSKDMESSIDKVMEDLEELKGVNAVSLIALE